MKIYLLSILCLVNGIYGMEDETKKSGFPKAFSLLVLAFQAICKYEIDLPVFLQDDMLEESVVLAIDRNVFPITKQLQKHVLNGAKKEGATVQDKIKAFNIWNSLNTLE